MSGVVVTLGTKDTTSWDTWCDLVTGADKHTYRHTDIGLEA